MSGVGKSALVNAIVGRFVAKTSITRETISPTEYGETDDGQPYIGMSNLGDHDVAEFTGPRKRKCVTSVGLNVVDFPGLSDREEDLSWPAEVVASELEHLDIIVFVVSRRILMGPTERAYLSKIIGAFSKMAEHKYTRVIAVMNCFDRDKMIEEAEEFLAAVTTELNIEVIPVSANRMMKSSNRKGGERWMEDERHRIDSIREGPSAADKKFLSLLSMDYLRVDVAQHYAKLWQDAEGSYRAGEGLGRFRDLFAYMKVPAIAISGLKANTLRPQHADDEISVAQIQCAAITGESFDTCLSKIGKIANDWLSDRWRLLIDFTPELATRCYTLGYSDNVKMVTGVAPAAEIVKKITGSAHACCLDVIRTRFPELVAISEAGKSAILRGILADPQRYVGVFGNKHPAFISFMIELVDRDCSAAELFSGLINICR